MRACVCLIALLAWCGTAQAAGWWLGGSGTGGTVLTSTSDITVDTITYNRAITACTGNGCGIQLQKILGDPDSADANTWRFYNDDKTGASASFFPSYVDAGGTSYTAAMQTRFASYAIGYLASTLAGDADGACAAAGTQDFTPECAREICSNVGMTCQTTIDMGTPATPVTAACTDLLGTGAVLIGCE